MITLALYNIVEPAVNKQIYYYYFQTLQLLNNLRTNIREFST